MLVIFVSRLRILPAQKKLAKAGGGNDNNTKQTSRKRTTGEPSSDSSPVDTVGEARTDKAELLFVGGKFGIVVGF